MTADLKAQARAAIEGARDELIGLSTALHAHPETAWQEHVSSARVADLLTAQGFAVQRPYLGFDTALCATSGSGEFRVGLMAEYDALPGLGHACGHNLIAASSTGAAIGLAAVAAAAGVTVRVYGTPAEEGGGGKIEMLERGAFTDLQLALMAHPAPVDVAEAQPFAVEHLKITYLGRAAHAAAYPTQGRNAADAFTVAQVALGLLRQHLPASVRVHGIVTRAGTAPNAIPGDATGRWYLRAATVAELDELRPRVLACFRAGALATGCEVTFEPESKIYTDFRTDEPALAHYRANAEALGRVFEPDSPAAAMNRASTDMGNVSQVVRAIHPYIGLGCYPVLNHQAEFADACIGPVAEQALLDAAVALAWTAIDVAAG